jgi:hypothetical protein
MRRLRGQCDLIISNGLFFIGADDKDSDIVKVYDDDGGG